MTETGLGVNGYIRVQKEVTFGTDIVAAMTCLPVLGDALFQANKSNIDNERICGSRMKPAPSPGRLLYPFTLPVLMKSAVAP